MLELKAVSSGYGMNDVLHSINLEVNKGEIVSVIGANGAGKTTLMRTISGVLKQTNGEIRFEKRNITKVPAYQRVELGLVQVPEGRKIFGPLSVLENLELGYFSKRKLGKKTFQERLDYVYHLFPILKERKDQKAGSLSGGQQQMLAIGRALMNEPKLLLLDEPSLGLSPLIVEQIFDVLENLNKQGLSILLVEQNAIEALRLSHRAYLMENGRIVLEGSSADLLHDSRVLSVYLGEERAVSNVHI